MPHKTDGSVKNHGIPFKVIIYLETRCGAFAIFPSSN
jgi:hypothetical protein